MAENCIQLLEVIVTQCETCSYITDSDNVVVGESFDVQQLPDTAFPRIEISPWGEEGRGYLDQYQVKELIWYRLVGEIRRDSHTNTSKANQIDIMAFAREVRQLMYDINKLKLAGGSFDVQGYEQASGQYELGYKQELVPALNLFELRFGFQTNSPVNL